VSVVILAGIRRFLGPAAYLDRQLPQSRPRAGCWRGRSGPVAARPGRQGAAWCGSRVSTDDYQDPVTSQARQRDQAAALVTGHGQIVAEYFDIGQSRTLAWARRLQAAALVAELADPGRGWDAVVIGEYERAFYGGQYASMAPLFEHYGIQLWTPEVGGRIDFGAEDHEQMMMALGLQSKREITRTKIRVRTAMAAQTREQGRYPRRPAAVRVPARGRRAAPEQGPRRVGPAAAPARAGPADGADRGMDLRAAAGRAQYGPDRPRPQRRRDPGHLQ
jgi:DNA invertase Pin-like site-specific DNA recombinase